MGHYLEGGLLVFGKRGVLLDLLNCKSVAAVDW